MPDSANGSRELDELGGGTAGDGGPGGDGTGTSGSAGSASSGTAGTDGPGAVRVARRSSIDAATRNQRDRRPGDTRRLSWPAIVLAGGVLLSLAANLAQAQPTAWGRIAAAAG